MSQQQSLFQPRPAIQEPVSADPWRGLRYYQAEACQAIVDGFQEHSGQLAVLATGLGKTQIFSAIARMWGGNVLVLAHREELLEQAKARLEQMTGEVVEIEQADRRASRKTRIVVGSLDTMRSQSRRDRFGKSHFSLVIQDECFPAGTLVDGVPIERIAHGDLVNCIDHATGETAVRPVVRRFSRLVTETVTLYHGATSLECTGNHPVYIKRGESVGYVQASRVCSGDMLCVLVCGESPSLSVSEAPENLLERVLREALVSPDGGDEPPLRIQAHDRAQPDAARLSARKDVGDSASYEAWAEDQARQRARSNSSRDGNCDSPGVANERGGEDTHAARLRVPAGLQAGCWGAHAEGRDRSGRGQSQRFGATGPGCQEGAVLAWSRVDRIARNQSASPGGTRVYNLEVEDCHTYFADGALVHNCHHALAKSYKQTLEWFDAKVLGVTATPDRGDEQALGKVFDSVAYCFDISQGIESGYLVPLRGRQVELREIQLDGLTKVAGDLAKGQLDEVMVRAVEGIVQQTLELEPGRQGIAFFPGVKSAAYAAERFNALIPGSAVFISGETPPDERRAMAQGFKDGKFRYLCNCMIATEGFDAPACSLIIQGRPTLSRALYAQMVGRGTRTLPGTVEHFEGQGGAVERRGAIASSSKPDAMVLDFVGNATKHALMTPEDLLGGDYSEEEIEEAKRKAKAEPGSNAQQLLAEARRELAAVAAAIRSKVSASVRSFNPFAVLDIDLASTTRDDMRWGRLPPSEKQLEALVKMKVPESAIKQMSQRQARQLLGERNKRHDAGLATYAQLAQLKRYGLDDKAVSFKNANRALTYVADKCGWKAERVNLEQLSWLASGGA